MSGHQQETALGEGRSGCGCGLQVWSCLVRVGSGRREAEQRGECRETAETGSLHYQQVGVALLT